MAICINNWDSCLGNSNFLLTDQVGTLRAVADTSGTIVKRIDYDSFGNIIVDSNPSFSVPFGFAGGLHDRDTGLVRFGYRDYSPELGRFVAKDPIDFAGGDTNLYAYAMSDPINFVDPWGLEVVFSRTGESVRYAYNRIKQTTRGKEIATRLEGSSQTYRIHVLPGSKGVGNYSDPKNTVLLPEVFTDGDVMTNLAHELGHAYQDDMVQPIEQIPNILDNENPIRSELGYPKRCP